MKTHPLNTVLLLRSTLCVGLLSSSAALQAQIYSAVKISTPATYRSEAFAINNAGTVVGLNDEGLRRSFFYSNGVVTNLPTLGGYHGRAIGINDAGVIVGTAETGVVMNSDAVLHAFSYDHGVTTDLGTLGGPNSVAIAINDAGTIVGTSHTNGFFTLRAFSYSNGVMTDIGTLGGSRAAAYAINNAGTIIGFAQTTGDAESHTFSYSNGVMTDLEASANISSAWDINDDGTIVGGFDKPGTNPFTRVSRAVSYKDGAVTELGVLEHADSSEATGINNRGVIVGNSWDTDTYTYLPFIYSDGVMTDLNTLVDLSDTILRTASGVNDRGQIIALGENNFAYLLTPIAVPEPSAYAFALSWLILAGVLIRRRVSTRTNTR